MRAKLGLADAQPADRELVEGILKLLAQDSVDYTIFWRRLSRHAGGESAETVRDLFLDREAFDAWLLQYSERLGSAGRDPAAEHMLKTNPKYVLRNHLGELAIRQAKLKDYSEVENLLALVQAPYDEHPGHEDKAGFPPDWASQIEISCFVMTYPVQKTEAEWKALLARKRRRARRLRRHSPRFAPRRPFTGKYEAVWADGSYHCICVR
jgi:uncharacterized protein YdiU (UPF0061 family)